MGAEVSPQRLSDTTAVPTQTSPSKAASEESLTAQIFQHLASKSTLSQVSTSLSNLAKLCEDETTKTRIQGVFSEATNSHPLDDYFDSLIKNNDVDAMLSIQKMGLKDSNGLTILEALLCEAPLSDEIRSTRQTAALQLISECPKEGVYTEKTFRFAAENGYMDVLKNYFKENPDSASHQVNALMEEYQGKEGLSRAEKKTFINLISFLSGEKNVDVTAQRFIETFKDQENFRKLIDATKQIRTTLPAISTASAFEIAYIVCNENEKLQAIFSRNMSSNFPVPLPIPGHQNWKAVKIDNEVFYISSEALGEGGVNVVYPALYTTAAATSQVASSIFASMKPIVFRTPHGIPTEETVTNFNTEVANFRALEELAPTMEHFVRPHVVREATLQNISQTGMLLQYCDGTFEDLFEGATQRPRSLPQLIHTAQGLEGMLKGIQFLHTHKFAHRDIKPGNGFFVKQNNELVGLLGDLTTVCKEGSPTPEPAGSLDYMAPEILFTRAEKRTATLEADMWAFGMTVYESLLGLNSPSLFEDAATGTPNHNFRDNYDDAITNRLEELKKISSPTLQEQTENEILSFVAKCAALTPKDRLTADAAVLALQKTITRLQLLAAREKANISAQKSHEETAVDGGRVLTITVTIAPKEGETFEAQEVTQQVVIPEAVWNAPNADHPKMVRETLIQAQTDTSIEFFENQKNII